LGWPAADPRVVGKGLPRKLGGMDNPSAVSTLTSVLCSIWKAEVLPTAFRRRLATRTVLEVLSPHVQQQQHEDEDDIGSVRSATWRSAWLQLRPTLRTAPTR